MNYAYGLATFNASDKVANGTDWVMKSLLDLSEEEYERCVQDCLALDTYTSDAQLFQIVLWNDQDFRNLIDSYVAAYTSKDFRELPPRSPDLNLNRCLLNLLSAVRSYLDYVELKVKRKYGGESTNALKFKKGCANAYDNSFSYRFLYRFRNYAQHCGLPLTRISFQSKAVEEESDRVDHALEIGIDRDELLQADFKWGTLRQDIAAQPALINITDHVGAMMEQLKQIHSNYIVEEFVTLRPAASRLQNLIEKVPGKLEELHLFKLLSDPSDPKGKVNFKTQLVPLRIVRDVFDERFAILFEENTTSESQ